MKNFLHTILILFHTLNVFSQGISRIEELPSDKVTIIKFGAPGTVWVGSRDNGVSYFDGSSWNVYNSGNSGLRDNHITASEIYDIGGISYQFFGTENGLSYLHAGTWDTLPLNDRRVRGIYKELGDTLWVASLTGISAFNASTLAPLYFQLTDTTADHRYQLSCLGNTIYPSPRVYGYAAGTVYGGYFYTEDKSTYIHVNTAVSGIRSDSINSISITNSGGQNFHMVAHNQGAFICDFGRSSCREYLTQAEPVSIVSGNFDGSPCYGWVNQGTLIMTSVWSKWFKTNNGFPSDKVTCMAVNPSTLHMWIGTEDAGITEIDTMSFIIDRLIYNSIQNTSLPVSFKCYPLPAGNEVHFESDSKLSLLSLTVQDIQGRPVQYLSDGESLKLPFSLDISQYPEGVYFYQFEIKGNSPLRGKFSVLK